ncbi:MAG: membrane protein YqaA with SNARE-associated domain [Bermanella sp.]|jgi:membrane protein YqaA with SNARE-associated domain
MEYFSEFGYAGLFIAAFLAATILPLGSEVVLIALLISGLPALPLVLVATAGNVLGSLTNYSLGYWASLDLIKRWLKLSESEFLRAKQRFTRYGQLSLLFAWIPIIGDPLTLIAGILRIKLRWFILLMGTGKLLRYVVVTFTVLQLDAALT